METAISVLAFSVVLAEAFAAVGLSTLVPSAFVQLLRKLKELNADIAAHQNDIDILMPMLVKALPLLPGQTDKVDDYKKKLQEVILDLLNNSDKLQLLVPKAATID